MKTRYKITIGASIAILAIAVFYLPNLLEDVPIVFSNGKIEIIDFSEPWKDVYSTNEEGKVDFSKMNLLLDDSGRIDYQKIGYLVSENKFKKLLAEQNIEYTSNNFVFIGGASRTSYPPYSSYCGYALANNNEDYWYSSSYHNDTLTNAEIYDKNPKPCESNKGSCLCALQTFLDEDSR